MRHLALLTVFLLLVGRVNAQSTAQAGPERPALVIGLVVDQMRWDYLYRYQDRYTQGGFRRLLREGFSCENTFIPFVPTYTAPGHACIYTGSVPALNGIIGNHWFDPAAGRTVYCTDDSMSHSVGSDSKAGRMSPRNMWTNTITDELRLATNFRSKTIALALKDRGAILPGGHTANAAIWFDNHTGGWISSSWYGRELPRWVRDLNALRRPDSFLKRNWNTLFPGDSYRQSTEDGKPYESRLPGGGKTFLHRTDTISGHSRYEAFRHTPHANTYTLETAIAAVKGEALGHRGTTDFLAISLSSTDYIGHTFGPNSMEMEDTYLRLDRDLDRFLAFLDRQVGKGRYLLFLTADHGAAHVTGFAQENRLPAGRLSDDSIFLQLNRMLDRQFGIRKGIRSVINYQVHLDEAALQAAGANRTAVKNRIIQELLQQPGISRALDLEQFQTPLPEPLRTMLINGYNQKLSGSIQFLYHPQWIDWGGNTGTTHGSWSPYDSHIPLLWFGWKQRPGRLVREVLMSDIAPTLAALLRIQMPNGATGKPIPEVVR